MSDRRLDIPARPVDLVLLYPRSWRLIILAGILCLLHTANAVNILLSGHFEVFISPIFAAFFCLATIAFYNLRRELAVRPSRGELCLATRLWRFRWQREIPFEQVQAVRIYLPGLKGTARIEIVCRQETLECPPTSVPRQEALCLAMAMHVDLVKITALPEDLESRLPAPESHVED